MTGFLLTRLAMGLATLLAVSLLVFAATDLLPGDVAQAVLGKDATPTALAQLRDRLHLTDSAWVRYEKWLGGMIRGNPGTSLAASISTTTFGETNVGPQEMRGVSVMSVIGKHLRNSLILMTVTAALLIPLSLLLGGISALRQNGLSDKAISMSTLSIISIPEFVIGSVLVLVFALAIPILPAVSLFDPSGSPLAHPSVLVLPVMTLLAASLAHSTRMVRAGILQVLDAPYVQMARLKGLPKRVIWRKYVLRNSLAASIQVLALNIAYLFGGVVVVEAVFQYPGVGSSLLQAISVRDVPVIQTIVMFVATIYVVLNLLADIATYILTPKLRTES